MELWKSLFSSGDTISKATDAVINAGDKMFYTDEEKMDSKIKLTEFFPNILKAYEPFKIAQRMLSFWFSLLFGVAFITGLSMTIFNAYIKYDALKSGVPLDKIVLLDIQPLIALVGAFSLGTIMMAIIGFYFLGGSIESFRRK